MHVLFEHSNGAKFAGALESVQIKDRLIIKVFASWVLNKGPNESVFNVTHFGFAGPLKFYAFLT